jgi:glyoxylase-like metal-dependent hydrolase (beta-lactamase superfamily II)
MFRRPVARLIDVMHGGVDRVIGAFEVGEGVVVDPGPASSVGTLLEHVTPRALLLTHIHLDHAGATGVLVRRYPDLKVYVHERGAPHLVDPSRLLRSAAQLYGDRMDELWGEVAPVPEGNIEVLSGGETVEGCRVAYAPGHASHHVVYLHEETGDAFVGDVAGVRVPPSPFTLAPTPPPDIDVERWNASLDLLEEWAPARLCLTHFGVVDSPGRQIERVRLWLSEWAPLARELSQEDWIARHRETIREQGGEVAQRLAHAAPPEQLWLGLNRYWSKRDTDV